MRRLPNSGDSRHLDFTTFLAEFSDNLSKAPAALCLEFHQLRIFTGLNYRIQKFIYPEKVQRKDYQLEKIHICLIKNV